MLNDQSNPYIQIKFCQFWHSDIMHPPWIIQGLTCQQYLLFDTRKPLIFFRENSHTATCTLWKRYKSCRISFFELLLQVMTKYTYWITISYSDCIPKMENIYSYSWNIKKKYHIFEVGNRGHQFNLLLFTGLTWWRKGLWNVFLC